jgi:hypothetical protein
LAETVNNIIEDENNKTINKTIKDNMDEIYDALENEIINSNSDKHEKHILLKKLRRFYNTQTNIMLVGATGCGKSSTINALFNCGNDDTKSLVEVARVGSKADPETKDIEKYTLGNLVLWDTPGLGDGTEIDEHHRDIIKELLREKDDDGNALIDLVLVILDGSTRDLGTSYKIINEIIVPEINETDRIWVALNQADIAMKTGRHWDYEKNEPDETLISFLENKLVSVKNRIKEDSGLDTNPIYYCAGYTEDGGDVVYPYNLSKLMYYILNAIPAHKRIPIMASINTDSDIYEHNDDDMDYNEEVKSNFTSSLEEFIRESVDTGANIGQAILGVPGALVGAVIGGAAGCIRGILFEIF